MASSLEFFPLWIVSALTIQFIKHFLDVFSYKKDEIRSEGKKNEQISALGSYLVGAFILLLFLVLFSSK